MPRAPLTCTSERRILPASCRRSAAPRYCCRWKELSRVLICSALNAVRSRRPPRPHGSSATGHSAPSSGTGCPAPDGLPPAPGDSDKDERVSQVRAPRGEPPPPLRPREPPRSDAFPGPGVSQSRRPPPGSPRLSRCRGTCGGSGRSLPAPAACSVPRARGLLLTPLAPPEAGAGAGPLAPGRCSAWRALGGALESLAALGQPFHGERGLSHPALFRRWREGGIGKHGPLLYTAARGGKRCLCKYTSKGQISIM